MTTDGKDSVRANAGLDSSRRKFARNAVAGSAVVLSLGNRAAWGQTITGTCLSTNVWTSYIDNGGAFLSAHPGHDNPENLDPRFDTAQSNAEAMERELIIQEDNFSRTSTQGADTCVVWDDPDYDPEAPVEPVSLSTFSTGPSASTRQIDKLK